MREARNVDVSTAHDSQSEVTRTMTDLGSSKAKHLHACSGTSKCMKALVHGDDFVSSGKRTEVEWFCKGLKNKFET